MSLDKLKKRLPDGHRLRNLKPDVFTIRGPFGVFSGQYDTQSRSKLDGEFKDQMVRVTMGTGKVVQGTYLSSDPGGIYLMVDNKKMFVPSTTLVGIDSV